MGVAPTQPAGLMLPFVVFLLCLGRCCKCRAARCEFEGIFNFGDSNSDTGGFWAAFPAQSGPFGMTYFKKPAGRACDGRLIIDFLAQGIGIPFLSPYLQSVGSDFRHGANYATLASTVLLPKTSVFVSGISPFSLAIQLNQMKQFKARVFDVQHSSQSDQGSTLLPSKDVFGKAIYTFYIGQNDFSSYLGTIGTGGFKQSLSPVISQIADTIKELYALGGRMFWVLNLAPVGCYPSFAVWLPPDSPNIDQFGCVISYNAAVVDYNNMLKDALSNTRAALPNASVLYVDVYSAMLNLFRHPASHGFKYGTRACCGEGGGPYNFNPKVYCGTTKVINGTKPVTASACEDPVNYVSWDGIHATEAANKIIALSILNGSLFDPPYPIQKSCHIRPVQ